MFGVDRDDLFPKEVCNRYSIVVISFLLSIGIHLLLFLYPEDVKKRESMEGKSMKVSLMIYSDQAATIEDASGDTSGDISIVTKPVESPNTEKREPPLEEPMVTKERIAALFGFSLKMKEDEKYNQPLENNSETMALKIRSALKQDLSR